MRWGQLVLWQTGVGVVENEDGENPSEGDGGVWNSGLEWDRTRRCEVRQDNAGLDELSWIHWDAMVSDLASGCLGLGYDVPRSS